MSSRRLFVPLITACTLLVACSPGYDGSSGYDSNGYYPTEGFVRRPYGTDLPTPNREYYYVAPGAVAPGYGGRREEGGHWGATAPAQTRPLPQGAFPAPAQRPGSMRPAASGSAVPAPTAGQQRRFCGLHC